MYLLSTYIYMYVITKKIHNIKSKRRFELANVFIISSDDIPTDVKFVVRIRVEILSN